MNEASKLLRTWGPSEWKLMGGEGIDIGCGLNPVTDRVRRFDLEDGDANRITESVTERFDFVFSSHCLEHMKDPREAILEWWKLVKPGGHLILVVPDEDLYEQGVFPSRFNADHKFTFTISKARSWSPVSINLMDLALGLPGGKLVKLELQDQGYDWSLLRHGPVPRPPRWLRFLARLQRLLTRWWGIRWPGVESVLGAYRVVDQSLGPEAMCQILCIVKKVEQVGA